MGEIPNTPDNELFLSRKRSLTDSLYKIIDAMDHQADSWDENTFDIGMTSASPVAEKTPTHIASIDVLEIPGSEPILEFMQVSLRQAMKKYQNMRPDLKENDTLYYPHLTIIDTKLTEYLLGQTDYVGRIPMIGDVLLSASRFLAQIDNATSEEDFSHIQKNLEHELFNYIWKVNCREEWKDARTFTFGDVTAIYEADTSQTEFGDIRSKKYSKEGVLLQAMVLRKTETGQDVTEKPLSYEFIDDEALTMIAAHIRDTRQWNQDAKNPLYGDKYYKGVVQTGMFRAKFLRQNPEQVIREYFEFQWFPVASINITPRQHRELQERYLGIPPDYKMFSKAFMIGANAKHRTIYGVLLGDQILNYTKSASPDDNATQLAYLSNSALTLINIIEPSTFTNIELGMLRGDLSTEDMRESSQYMEDFVHALEQPTIQQSKELLVELHKKLSLPAIRKIIEMNMA